eukprot:3746651-Pyramimonas_sp.AAC.1
MGQRTGARRHVDVDPPSRDLHSWGMSARKGEHDMGDMKGVSARKDRHGQRIRACNSRIISSSSPF